MKKIELDFSVPLWDVLIHTDFEITDEVIDKINRVAGVERTLDRRKYKVGVEIGKLFDADEVSARIVNAIG